MFHARYWDSSFFGHAKHNDLNEPFRMTTKMWNLRNYIKYLWIDRRSMLNSTKKFLEVEKDNFRYSY